MDIKINKGHDLPIAGAVDEAANSTPRPVASRQIAIVPDDFAGLVTKVCVHPGDKVNAGDALLYAKSNPTLQIVSPVGGTVAEVVRGERRKVMRVVVDADKPGAEQSPRTITLPGDAGATEADAATPEAWMLAQSGLLALMRTRPYDIVPDPRVKPRDIFVTALDTAPLAPKTSLGYTRADAPLFEAAVTLLSKATDGKVYISRRSADTMPDIKGAEMVNISGPHPAGLAGTLIAAVAPVCKGQTVWTMDAHTLFYIGQLATKGCVDWKCRVAVTGSDLETPYIAECVPGTAVADLLAPAGVKDDGAHRIISGNVLTGVRVTEDGFLRRPYTQLTVIPECTDKHEFLGWASVSPDLLSLSPSYPGFWLKRLFKPDARIRGGRRAMIMSGIYEDLIPLDILPEYLIKAIHSQNIDDMERLGIYEVAPEDFALAEFADSSKLPLQQIVRGGLDLMRKESE